MLAAVYRLLCVWTTGRSRDLDYSHRVDTDNVMVTCAWPIILPPGTHSASSTKKIKNGEFYELFLSDVMLFVELGQQLQYFWQRLDQNWAPHEGYL